MAKEIYVYRAALIATIVFTLVMAWLPHPPAIPGRIDDKIQHIAAFLTLSLLASLAYPQASSFRLAERLSFMGALIEVVQNIPALHRDCSIFDWIADTAAIALMFGLIVVWRRFQPERLTAQAPPRQ